MKQEKTFLNQGCTIMKAMIIAVGRGGKGVGSYAWNLLPLAGFDDDTNCYLIHTLIADRPGNLYDWPW